MFEIVSSYLGESKRRAAGILATLLALNAYCFGALGASVNGSPGVAVSFLNVGQGDASLIDFGDGVQVLIDGGPPNGKLLATLGGMLPATDRTIELMVLTHPELDHYGGFVELVNRYTIGVFLDTGVTKNVEAYETLVRAIEARGVRRITLRAGDVIRYGASIFTVLSPDDKLAQAREKNDTSMVLAFETSPPAGLDGTIATSGARFLFTGDIGADVERVVSKIINTPFDVLKVAHHGSKFSSAAEFIAAVRPTLAAIGVGKNSYGHPTKETLSRLEAAGARVYRTDRDGTVTVRVEKGALLVFDEK